MARLFIAVPIVAPPALAEVAERLAAMGRSLKPVPVAALHVTLAFLGEVEEAVTGDLRVAMSEAAAGVTSGPLELRGLGTFPDTRRPKVIWCGMAGGEWLTALEARLRPRLAAMGVQTDDRPFHPHVTLARVRTPHRRDRSPPEGAEALLHLLAEHRRTTFGRCHPPALHLIRSTLTPGAAPIHTIVHRVAWA